MMKTLAPLGGLLLAVGVCSANAAESPDAVFDRYVDAVHAGDMAAVRALIAADVERSDFAGCRPDMDNVSCLAHYIEATVVAPKARLTEISRRVDGNSLSSSLEVRSPLYTTAGVERIVGRDVLTVRGGLIRAFRFVPDFSDAQTVAFFATLGIGPGAAKAGAKP
jgi:hypothetical protein